LVTSPHERLVINRFVHSAIDLPQSRSLGNRLVLVDVPLARGNLPPPDRVAHPNIDRHRDKHTR